MQRLISIILLVSMVSLLCGCTGTQKGAVVGALSGAAIGGAGWYLAQDKETEDVITGVAVGALVGAVVGGVIGYYAEE